MIRYALICDAEHGFEAWFSNSAEYDRQAESGLVECPQCGITDVRKAVMAPAVASPKRRKADPEKMAMALAGQVRAHIRNNFEYVGDKFADAARDIHAGKAPHREIYGEATAAEAEALRDDGVPCAPLPAPFVPVPPKKTN